MARDKGRTYDGISRPTNKKYEENWNTIFGNKNPVAKEVRTPKYRSKIVKPKKGKGSFKRNKEPDEGWSGIV